MERADAGAKRTDQVVVYAGIPARIAAYFVDAVILSLLFFAVLAVLTLVIGPTVRFVSPLDVLRARVVVDPGRVVLDALVTTALSAAYFAFSWNRMGASPGQWLLGLRLRDRRGRIGLGVRDALIRWALLGPPLGLIAVIVGTLAPLLRPSAIAVAAVWQLILLVTTTRNERKQGIHDRAAGSTVVTSSRLADRVGSDGGVAAGAP
ncbi:MAG TPA: RDD family protein [Candidatus Limnocylindria bacterium]|nr:RDD family protein [Candidatus Limnocylindria bacterium]